MSALPPPKKSEQYFRGTSFIFKFLRLLNLMEPDRAVLSLSKMFFYVSMFVLVHVVMTSPENIVAVLTATSTNVMALMNYVHRRHVQIKVAAAGEPNDGVAPIE